MLRGEAVTGKKSIYKSAVWALETNERPHIKAFCMFLLFFPLFIYPHFPKSGIQLALAAAFLIHAEQFR